MIAARRQKTGNLCTVLPIRQGTLLIREAVTLGQLNPDRIFGNVTIFQPHLCATGCHSAAFLFESYSGWSKNKFTMHAFWIPS
jgi:hypothetical protein